MTGKLKLSQGVLRRLQRAVVQSSKADGPWLAEAEAESGIMHQRFVLGDDGDAVMADAPDPVQGG